MMKTARRSAVIVALVSLFVQLFIPASMAIAASMTNTKVADWRNTWHLHLFNGLHWTDTGMWMKKVDGKVAFCVEHGVDLDMSGSGYNPSTYSDAKKDQLAKIAYYGYYQNPTNRNYAVTQMIIWETLGDSLLTTPNKTYQSEKKAILDKVAAHDRKPSFNGKQITLAVGDSITLTDTNGRLAAFAQQTANTANLKITKSGNKLTLTATAQSKESSKVAYAIAKAADVGTSFFYTKGSQQKLVNFKLSSNGEFSLPIKVNLNGNLKAKKVDADTSKALPGAKLKFEYNGTTKEVTTGTDGYTALNGIKAGTKIKISEVTAPNGYVNKGELKEVTIEPGKTVEVVLGNKEQLGNVTLAKIGKEFGSDMFNAHYSLNGAVYGIYTSTGTRVGAITTDGNGKGTLQNLKLGSYFALEEKAPAGYILNTAKLPFELKYAGQTVSVTTAHVDTTDQEQRGTATIIKEDAVTGKQPQGAASLNGTVYELHRAADDKLVKSVTIANNIASVSGLELDDYYWQEVKAPTGYVLDPQKHSFKLAYAGQNVTTATATTTVKEQVITGDLDFYDSLNIKLVRPFGDMLGLHGEFIPASKRYINDYIQYVTSDFIASLGFGATQSLGEKEGIYIGYNVDTGRNVYLQPDIAAQGIKGTVTNALSAAFLGSLGGGKSFSNNLLVYYAVLYGAQALILDPKSERTGWAENLDFMGDEINIVNLTSEEQNRGLLDPYIILSNLKDSESLAVDTLTFLTGISSRNADRFPTLRKAIRAVAQAPEPGLLKVIDELRREDTPIARNIADHIESFTDYDFAALLFSDGTARQTITLDRKINIVQIADLVLPDADKTQEEYITAEMLSVAMLMIISTFAIDFIHQDRAQFKIVDLDEAWAFLNVAQGKALSMKLIREGRSMNAGVYLVTQNADDLLDEKMKNNIAQKFAFRSTDITEIKNTLNFFGLDAEDESNQSRLRSLDNGECLFQDIWGHVGVLHFDYIFEHLHHAFDTRPPKPVEVISDDES